MSLGDNDRLRIAADAAGRFVGTAGNGIRPQMFITDQEAILMAHLFSHLLASHPDLGEPFRAGRESVAVAGDSAA